MSYKQLRDKLNRLTVEELANTLTHGFGLLLSVAGLILLVLLARAEGDIWHFVSVFIYGGSLIALYTASTFYHGATSPKLKERLQLIDHCCIYILIAGSYTPFTLVALRGNFGTGLFIFVWFFALIGIVAKVFFHKRFRAASVISYLVMGWIGIIVVQPLFMKIGFAPLVLVIAGGIAYSLGTIFYGWENLRHHHAVWHLFVLAGSILHFLAISIYVIPFAFKI